MKYISGIFALNISCELETCGDWHTSALNWENIDIKESDDTIFKDYGIEKNKEIIFLNGRFCVANHIRACLDLMVENKLSLIEGMNNDFICNENYDKEIFKKVLEIRHLPNWENINLFMEKEYLLKWINFLKSTDKRH